MEHLVVLNPNWYMSEGFSVQTSDWSDWLVTHKPPPPPTLQHSVSRQRKIKGFISKDAYAGW